MQFRATIQQNGKTATGIPVPDEIVESLNSGKRPKVKVTINGYTYRNSIASMGGVYMLAVSSEVRENAGVSAGDEVDVFLELDTDVREVVLPADFVEALNADEQAKQYFESLSYSNKRRVVIPIEDAKKEETRQNRIAKTISKLHDGKI